MTTPTGATRLHIVPCSIQDAKRLVRQWHRHHPRQAGGLFAVGVADEQMAIHGVAIIGRPVARNADDGWTCEVVRCATDGTPNACSALYGAAWRAAKALGWRMMITYTLPSEGGASLRGAGWREASITKGHDGWLSRHGRQRGNTDDKTRWEIGCRASTQVHPTRRVAATEPDPQVELPLEVTP